MCITRWSVLAASPVLTILLAGCNPPVYKVLEDLPSPPTTLGATARSAAPTPVRRPIIKPDLRAPADLPAGWIPRVREQRWRYIVIHHSATERGCAATFDKMHREVRGWDELGYHFVINNGHGGADGKIEVGSRWTKQKWGAHCGGTPNNEYNDYGIGICLVGNFQTRLPSGVQMASLRKLVRFLVGRYHIPRGNAISHRDAPNAATKCPGDRLHRHLKSEFAKEIGR